MSAGRRPARRSLPLAAVSLLAAPALAQQPDLAFLEYLGSFETDDEPWYVDVQLQDPEQDAAAAGPRAPGKAPEPAARATLPAEPAPDAAAAERSQDAAAAEQTDD